MSSSTVSKLQSFPGLSSAKKIVGKLAGGASGVHAVLFYGSDGSGKDDLALVLAQAWMCLSPGPEGACGQCKSCGAFERGMNADILEIAPVGPSRIILVGGITEVKEPKEYQVPLRTFFRMAPLLARSKVAWIRDAHRMNSQAYNALLKTLEEPASYARIVLTTSSIGSVPPTILSRCLAIACELPTRSEIQSAFLGVTEADLRLAEGAPGRVRQLLERPEVYRPLAEFARSLLTRRVGESLIAADEFRGLAEAIDSACKCGARAANAEALLLLGAYLSKEEGAPPIWPQLVVEAHRRILGNAAPAQTFDALFAQMLLQ